MREIIQSQINLLADLNRELASQTTPEAAREIRENVKLLAELGRGLCPGLLTGAYVLLKLLCPLIAESVFQFAQCRLNQAFNLICRKL